MTPDVAQTKTSRRPRLELDRITKRYGKVTAVDDVSLSLAEGEFLTFLGQSGSGKTTVLKIIAGFETCDDGAVRIAGTDMARKPPRDRDIGMVFQNYALFPHMSVADNIAYGLRRRKWPAERRRARVRQMLELVRLAELGGRSPRELSGGQQQRVALARALACEPQLLLMDEPLGALDRALRLDLEQEIRRIHRSTGCSVVYVTHDRDEALALSDRIAVFHAGRVVGLDEPAQLYERPPTGYVARLLTDANLAELPDGTALRGDVADIVLGGRTVRFRSTATRTAGARLAVPRTSISLQPQHEGCLTVEARVDDVVFLGEHARIDLDTTVLGSLIAHVPMHQTSDRIIGETLRIHIDPARCQVVI
ncbi:ABC transporter ATP-binding protein [Thermoactinospora rubra]|uniref:ABC transporter ATP-binding protein n=1 Tax=Thermoactinospora rubra TaxID=1088767 RepID=UPI000A10F04C|nr:ABC transporter ATP-binding protein [Thermoactinospora rubra]